MGMNEAKYKSVRKSLLKSLAELAKEKNITQQEIADKTGFARNNVSRMLKGRYPPTLDNFIRLAEAVGYDVAVINKMINKKVYDKLIDPKFLISINPKDNQLYILHRQWPSCLIWVKQEIPMRFIVQDLYDDMENPADILNMPFVEEAKLFFKKYAEKNLDNN